MTGTSTDIDQAWYRQVLRHFPTGVVIVTAMSDGGPAGLSVGSFMSVSLDPPLVLVWSDVRHGLDREAVLGADVEAAQQLGRHFIVGYTHREDVALLAARGLIGGIYVTGHNIAGRTAADVKSEIAGLQALRAKAGLPPLIIAADQEGGIVSHLSPPLAAMPATFSGLLVTQLPSLSKKPGAPG